MRKEQWLVVVLMLGIAAALLGQPTPVDAGRPFGTQITIRNEEPIEVQPAVAYNSQQQEYLVVFWNDRPGNDDIRAERVSKSGQLLGGTWISAGEGYDRRCPDVTYNVQTNQYLVVWQHYYQAVGGYAIHGRLISAAGQIVGTMDIIIRGLSVTTPDRPAVAYASTSNKYLVVWEEEYRANPTDVWVNILGQAVNSDGTLSGNRFAISSDPGGQPRRQPDVAYNRHANGFLVVWQQYDGTSDWDIYGQLVNGDGSILPGFPPIQVAWYIQSSITPAVAAIPTAPGAYKYLVVWEADVGAGNWDIYGKLVEENGTPHPSAFPIANDPAAESSPAVAGTEYGHQYLVTWRLPRGTDDAPIQGRTVAYDGVLLDDPSELPSHDAYDPAVAAGLDGEFLLAWHDQPPKALNGGIYGQLWGDRVPAFLPLILRHG
jgi:hypothetical protein